MSMHDTLPTMATVARTVGATLAATGITAVAVAEEIGKGGFGETATPGQLVEFQLTGLLVVFIVLGALTFLCYLIGWILKMVAPDQYHGKPKPSHAPVPAAKAPAPVPAPRPADAAPAVVAPATTVAPATIHPGLSDEQLMAILAVAATETLGQAVAVVSFRPLGSMDWTWSIQGRVQHHSSHAL